MSSPRDIDEQINALAKEKERYIAESRALAEERRRRPTYDRDARELPLVVASPSV